MIQEALFLTEGRHVTDHTADNLNVTGHAGKQMIQVLGKIERIVLGDDDDTHRIAKIR